MTTAEAFNQFLSNLVIANRSLISTRYERITAACNKEFRDTDSKTANSLQIGSYGRKTGIHGLSDLDMIYILPESLREKYRDNPTAALARTKKAIESTYSSTEVSVDRLVVVVQFEAYRMEVQPCFEEDDGGFLYPDTYRDEWLLTMPRKEMEAVTELDDQTNSNLRDMCKMARAWKNKHGQKIGGLLVDTLCYQFLQSTNDYDETGYSSHGKMARDFFQFLTLEPTDQEFYRAPGSGQKVKIKKSFHRKAKKALALSEEALKAEGQQNFTEKWRKVFGRSFPLEESIKKTADESIESWRDTEEFIENMFPFDIRYSVRLECEVTQSGFRPFFLTSVLNRLFKLKANKSLRFFIADIADVPKPYKVFWKVLNRGPVAWKKNCVRGQIVPDKGYLERAETTNFRGDHIVECYIVKEGVVVATDRIHVPIDDSP